MVLFGDQWLGAVDAARIMCLAALIRLFAVINDQVMVSVGLVKEQFYLNLLIQPLKIGAVVLLASNGLTAAAIGVALGDFCYALGSQVLMFRILKKSSGFCE